jgi:hypothetical protein
MRGAILTTLFSLLFMLEVYPQDTADYIIVKRNIFIDAYVKREGMVYPSLNQSFLLGTPSVMHRQSEAQMFFKTPTQTYIYNISTGRIYRLEQRTDTTFRFNRIDHTFTEFYNIGAALFTVGEDIYNFGGYGFWKTNGSLRRFNFKDREWDIVPLSQEIIPQFFPYISAWVNAEQQKVYVPFQRIVNEGVWQEGSLGKVVKESWVLDLSTATWKKIGKVNEQFLSLLKDGGGGYSNYQDANGLLLFQNRKLFWIDYNNNRVLTMDDALNAQTIERSGSGQQLFQYLYKGFIYYYNPVKDKYDSLKIDLSQFNGPAFPIWQPDYSSYYPYAALLLLIVVLLFVWRYWTRWVVVSLTPKNAEKINVELDLSEMEAALLKLLIEKSEQKECSTIDEINYVLGLKDKNLGIQKKVRSDLINGLNQKYSLVMKEEDHLVSSVRSEGDKRYFEYFIVPDKLPVIKGILQAKTNGSLQ